MSDEQKRDEETEEGLGVETEAVADAVVAAGVKSGKKMIGAVASLAVTAMIGSAAVFFWPDRQSQVVGVSTWTPEPSAIQPAPADINRPAVQVVEAMPQETEADRRIQSDLQKLEQAVANLAAALATPTPDTATAGGFRVGQAVGPDAPAQDVIEPFDGRPQDAVAATTEPQLSIWEDGGGCWTPADISVLHLCGADAGDGYVIRWIGVAGDSRGPEIPDSDYLAVRGEGDQLVWAGNHPATGEAVTVTYWAAGHVLAVHAAGRLLFRIDRNHGVVR